MAAIDHPHCYIHSPVSFYPNMLIDSLSHLKHRHLPMLFYPYIVKKALRLVESLEQRQQIRCAKHTQFFGTAHSSLSFQHLQIFLEPQLDRGSTNALRLVNTFSDSLLSRDFEGRIVVTVEPFNWREIIKVLLDAGGIVKAVDEGENALRRFLPGAEPADGVYQLLLED